MGGVALAGAFDELEDALADGAVERTGAGVGWESAADSCRHAARAENRINEKARLFMNTPLDQQRCEGHASPDARLRGGDLPVQPTWE
jgi:hypothetical protein